MQTRTIQNQGRLKNYNDKIIKKLIDPHLSIKKIKKELFSQKYIIPNIKDKNNVIQHNQSDILKIMAEFYKNLYTSNNNDNHQDLDLTNNIKDDIPEILESEISTIIKKLNQK